MPQEPSYKQAYDARNASRIVVEGIDDKPKGISSHIPEGYKSPDVEDRRNDTLADKAVEYVKGKIIQAKDNTSKH